MNRDVLKLKITIRKPDRESIILFLWLCKDLFLAAARYVLTSVGLEDGALREMILFIIGAIPLIYFFISLLGRRSHRTPKWVLTFLLIYFAVFLAFLISWALNPRLSEFYFRKSYGIGPVFRPDGALFAFLLFSMFDDPAKLRNVLLKSAYVVFFYLVVVVFVPAMVRGYWIDIAPGGGMMRFSYSLSFGYDLLFPLTVFFITAMKSKKIIHYAIVLVSAILIVMSGGRGAIVVLGLFIALLIISSVINSKTSAVKKFFLIAGTVFVGVVVLLFGDYFWTLFIMLLTKFNVGSRSIDMIINGSFSDSHGRSLIWGTVWEAIRSGGIFGYGLFGDRPFVAPIHAVGYSHNLFLELLTNFGIIGVGFIIYIMIDVVKMLFFCKDEDWRIVYFILFICSCKLLLSLSFWYTWEFWAAAAVAYKYRIASKKKRLGAELQNNQDF